MNIIYCFSLIFFSNSIVSTNIFINCCRKRIFWLNEEFLFLSFKILKLYFTLSYACLVMTVSYIAQTFCYTCSHLFVSPTLRRHLIAHLSWIICVCWYDSSINSSHISLNTSQLHFYNFESLIFFNKTLIVFLKVALR